MNGILTPSKVSAKQENVGIALGTGDGKLEGSLLGFNAEGISVGQRDGMNEGCNDESTEGLGEVAIDGAVDDT